MVRPARLERATCGFEVRRSIQLSYGRMLKTEELWRSSAAGFPEIMLSIDVVDPILEALPRVTAIEDMRIGLWSIRRTACNV
jgi:hypothetical protein